jgi:hypothetical protein
MSACALTVAVAALTAPAAPAQPAPLDAGATFSATEPASSTAVRYIDLNPAPGVVDPQFSWDPIPGATRYEVEVNSSNDWAVGSRVCCDERAIGTSLSPLKLLPNNTYYWRMRAFDAASTAGPWTQWCGDGVASCPNGPRGFEKTFDAVIPSIPNLRVRDSTGDHTPAIGASGFPTTGAPVVAWDPVPGASSYELKLAPWSPLGFCNWTSSAGPTYTTASTAWTPLAQGSGASPVGNTHPGVTRDSPLQSGTSYCVRERARSDRDAMGAEIVSDWTQIGGLGHAAFTYEAATLPPCGATSMPASAYHDEPSGTTATPRMPLFTWDRVTGACGYYIVIAKDPDFTKVVDVAFTTVPAYSPRGSGGPVTYTDETTSYYWAVMPSASANGDGVSTQPQEDHPQTFNKRSVPPTPIAPKTGVTGEPSFQWTAAEGARSYRIQVDQSENFGSPITDVVTDSTAYTSLNKYPANTLLYWRVRANDETGVGLGWSTVAMFSALPPETYINTGPLMTGSTAAFTFASNLPDASFKCKLDGPGTKLGVSAACGSPKSYPSLAGGTYTFSVAAADLAGNADPTPETRSFTVDATAPDTVISVRPAAATRSMTAAFSFTATQDGSTFECKLDGPGGTTGTWGPCTSPKQYDGLADGGYTFSVRATDAAGNTDATPSTSSFNVDTQAPDTLIATGPAATAAATTAAFRSAGSEAGSRLECRLDGPSGSGGWASCGSSITYSYLAAGSYGFSVRATDAAGNTDATPATWTFALTAPAGQQLSPGISAAGSSTLTTLTTPTSPAVSPAPLTHRLGVPTFPTPSRPVRVLHGMARLRFRCSDPDGCAAATFVISRPATRRRPAFAQTVKVTAAASGDHIVAVKLSRSARRSLSLAGRLGMQVRMARTGIKLSARFRLVASR